MVSCGRFAVPESGVPARVSEVLEFIGANIRRARHAAGLSQEALAAAANLSARFLQDLEVGRGAPSIRALVEIANVLGITVGALFRRTKLPRARVGRPRTRK